MLLPKKVRLEKPISAAHEKIFKFLLRVNEERRIHSTLRVAGGWVRDAILGLHSQDIDIAIESPESRHVSGEFFAREVSAYQEEMGMAARTVSVIRVNPELSKHIETATICVYDTPIEFCALRHDEYTNPGSRIPVVRPATALEDALRRDFTVNTLFLNLHTMEVEDYTTGLEDLQRRVLRCPLDPRETFSDDPLRLLRGIRFVGQLGEHNFSLDESVLCCVTTDLLEKMSMKVSRERVGIELVKMLSGSLPEKCVKLLLQLGVLQHVLLVELYFKSSKKGHLTGEVERAECLASSGSCSANMECLRLLNQRMAPLFSKDGSPLFLHSSSDKVAAMLFLLCLPFYRDVSREQLADRLYALCVHGLRLPLALYNIVRRMLECFNTLTQQRLNVGLISHQGVVTEVKLAVFEGLCDLNDKKVFPLAFKVVFAAYVLLGQQGDLLSSDDLETAVNVIEQKWLILEREPGVLNAMSRKLPLKGDELSKLVPLNAPQIGPALLALRRYMMLHPDAAPDDMISWLRSEKERLVVQ